MRPFQFQLSTLFLAIAAFAFLFALLTGTLWQPAQTITWMVLAGGVPLTLLVLVVVWGGR